MLEGVSQMMHIAQNPTISELQKFIENKCIERGWTERTDVERVMMLAEEIGEVAKEIRKHTGKFGHNKPENTDDLASELIDVLNWIVDIANNNKIDLGVAFQKKWQHNDRRTWNIA